MRWRCLGYTVLLLALLARPGLAATYYIAPAGSDAANGTSTGTPWQTFAHAIPLLEPGDTLTVMDGTYTRATHGMMSVTCGSGGIVTGTVSQPITVRAQNERKALLSSGGTIAALYVSNCAYWVFQGLYMAGADNVTNDNAAGSVILVRLSQHLTFRRNLVIRNNRYWNGHLFDLATSDNTLIEENEFYYAHRHGISLFSGTPGSSPSGTIIRRNYLHSRAYADIPGGRYSGDTTRGDSGINCYPCRNTIVENNIIEGWDSGADIEGKTVATNNQFLGNMTLNNGYGMVFTARNDFGNSLDSMPQNTQVTNYLNVGADHGPAWYMRATKNSRCDQCTFVNLTATSTSTAVNGDIGSNGSGDGLPTIYGSNILIWQTAGIAMAVTNHLAWGFDYVMSYVPSLTFTPPSETTWTHITHTNPQLGSCRVFIPVSSPAHAAGLGGRDIGATILNRYENGVLTSTPLWDPVTGAFPCGAKVAGVNDVAGSSCFDVHTRLNVNANGCSLPGEAGAAHHGMFLVF